MVLDGVRRLILVRHGESVWNGQGRLQGQRDVPLSATGRRQAGRLAGLIAEIGPDAAVTSDLVRARETCALLGHPEARADARWREADLGEWTGRLTADLRDAGDGRYAAWRAGTLTPDGGEASEALRGRVDEALAAILADQRTWLVVTHGGPIRMAIEVLLGLPIGRLSPVAPASATVIDLGDQPRLLAYNLTPRHAPGDAPD